MMTDWRSIPRFINVLVVDDSRTSRMLIRHLIEQLNSKYHVIEANGAENALSSVQGKQIQCAVIDYNMPQVNGLDLALLLKQHFPNIKLAIISADSHLPVKHQHQTLAFTQLSKPIQPFSLAQFLGIN